MAGSLCITDESLQTTAAAAAAAFRLPPRGGGGGGGGWDDKGRDIDIDRGGNFGDGPGRPPVPRAAAAAAAGGLTSAT